MKISVVGLGKLGEPLAVCLAYRGFDVLGVDLDKAKTHNLNNGTVNTAEPNLQEYFNNCIDSFEATTITFRAVKETDVTFLLVDTPSNDDGTFSSTNLTNALTHLAIRLRKEGKPYHLFVIGSTVSPGTCENELIPVLERQVDRDRFGLVYAPEFVALGDCVNGFCEPDMVVIGQSDERAGNEAEDIYRYFCGATILRMSLPEAEILKVALNFFLTLKISYANTLATICERFPGADVDVISDALGHDSRIAPKFLRGGLAFGGFCFPRDVAAFDALLQAGEPLPHELTWAVDEVNKAQHRRLLNKVIALQPDSISVLGLSFKPGTPEIEASPAITLIRGLLISEYLTPIAIFDPLAMDNARDQLGQKVDYAPSATECAAASPVVVIATAWDGWRGLQDTDFQEGATVIDCWRIMRHLEHSERVTWLPLGIGR
jgi:UDPglucose 6-dehydrogenase